MNQLPLNMKLKAGSRMYPVQIDKVGDRLELSYGYNPELTAEVKAMQGAKYHGYLPGDGRKIWSINDSQRNHFQLGYLAHPGASDPLNPYHRYLKPLVPFQSTRNLYAHQNHLASHGLTRHYCEFGAEMGTGKTLAAFEVIDHGGAYFWIYVAPKSAMVSAQREYKKWKPKVEPLWVTYDGLKKMMGEWKEGRPAPEGVIFDESSRVKTPTAQRSQACQYLADAIRNEHADKGFVILMSGSPAPKSPLDWWNQCEIACPGYIKEGTPEKFKKRLSLVKYKELFAGGGSYPELITWFDDEKKCKHCGLMEDDPIHLQGVDVFSGEDCHTFENSVNEVAHLYKRLSGLVMIKFKKDCLDLPDKVYRVVYVKPTRSILNAASAITAKSTTTISALTLLRELSDGFQYVETPTGVEGCPQCHGTLKTTVLVEDGYVPTQIEYEKGCHVTWEEDEIVLGDPLILTEQVQDCTYCDLKGHVPTYTRAATEVPCPKEEALLEILDEHEDIGRIVIYGGFTGSVDRCCGICIKAGWTVIRVDGRGWDSTLLGKPDDLLSIFQDKRDLYAKVAFIGQPGAAGMGLTLTASPTIVYYSNDFNGESRTQSEDRIHRIGMDVNRGATIIDIVHLPSDKVVLTSLQKKRKLEHMTMGEMRSAFSDVLTLGDL